MTARFARMRGAIRSLPVAPLLAGLLAGCAGQVRDFVGSRSSIVTPQLIRYGLDLREMRCVSEQLGNSLSPRQLRRFEQRARSVRQGYFEPERLTARDLAYVAGSMSDPQIGVVLARANAACGVDPEAIAAGENIEAQAPPAAPPAAAPAAAWLNLGAAPTGQAIAVDASTIEQDSATRTAWFRLTNPGAGAPTGLSYRLRIDCARRTIGPLAERRPAGAGAPAEQRDYGREEQGPLPIEGGTVMEIAYLALCT